MYVVAVVEEEKCIGCKACAQTCPEPNAISIIKKPDNKNKAFVVSSRCKGCGLCEVTCPKKAITLMQISSS